MPASSLHGFTCEGALRGYVWGGLVRIFLVHHVTWSVNSVCHFFGRRRFDIEDQSTNVAWLALLSLGESWHHNHHAFPRSAFHGLQAVGDRPVGPADLRRWSASAWPGTSSGSRPSASSRRPASRCRLNSLAWVTTGNSPELLDETRAFNVELERLIATVPAVDAIPPEESRRARREGLGIFPKPVFVREARSLEIDGPARPDPLRVIAPERRADRRVPSLPRGGWTVSASDLQDRRLQRLARDTGLTVVSVEYRLAPEHPYPAGPDDCEAAALWLLGEEGRDAVRHRGRLRSAAIPPEAIWPPARCCGCVIATGSPARSAPRCSSTARSTCR